MYKCRCVIDAPQAFGGLYRCTPRAACLAHTKPFPSPPPSLFPNLPFDTHRALAVQPGIILLRDGTDESQGKAQRAFISSPL